jgi:hypothetical protein
MPDTPEFKFKLEIHTKGGTKHLLAVAALVFVLSIPVVSYIAYLHFH